MTGTVALPTSYSRRATRRTRPRHLESNWLSNIQPLKQGPLALRRRQGEWCNEHKKGGFSLRYFREGSFEDMFFRFPARRDSA